MNQYGALVQRHYQRHLPHRYAQLTDPTAEFTQIGEQIDHLVQTRADALTQQYARNNPPGTDFRERLSQLQAARLTAEESTLQEFLPSSEDTDAGISTTTPL